jgi:cell division septation protein DedD
MSLSKTPRSPAVSAHPVPQRNPQSDRSRVSADNKARKHYRFEWTLVQLVMFGCGSAVVMAWMFAFGVLVGRDLPLADDADQSLRGQMVRFMGLPHKGTRDVPEPVATVEDPGKLLEELDYHKALTQKPETSVEGTPAKGDGTAAKKSGAKPTGGEAVNRPNAKASVQGERPVDRKEAAAPGAASGGHEAHALLVASLRSQENAQKLVQQLRAKGYDPQLETLDKTADGRWYRVIVGSFKNREDAQRFGAEFNKREKAQAMVIRLTP